MAAKILVSGSLRHGAFSISTADAAQKEPRCKAPR